MKARDKVVATAGATVTGIGGLVLLYFGSLPPDEVVALCRDRGFEPVEISKETWACGEKGKIKEFLEGASPVVRRTR